MVLCRNTSCWAMLKLALWISVRRGPPGGPINLGSGARRGALLSVPVSAVLTKCASKLAGKPLAG